MARINVGLVCLRELLIALSTGAYSAKELSEKCGFGRLIVDEYLRYLHKKPNVVYIALYKKRGPRGQVTAYWSLGYMQEDAERPKPQDKAEKNRRQRQRMAILKERGLFERKDK
jgi:hypothetical protein